MCICDWSSEFPLPIASASFRTLLRAPLRSDPPGEGFTRARRVELLAVGLLRAALDRGEQAEIDVHRLIGRSLGGAGDVAEQRAQRGGGRRRRQRVSGKGAEERRVGKECVITGRSRWSRYHSKKKECAKM